MDPKALDHLDPKQKEAYARIMGHAAGVEEAAQTAPPAVDAPVQQSDFMVSPMDTFSDSLSTTPDSSFDASPLANPLDATSGNQPQFYTPGQQTQPAETLPSDPTQLAEQLTSSPFDPSLLGAPKKREEDEPNLQENMAPPNSSFFSNPSPEVPQAPYQESAPEGIPAVTPDPFTTPGPVTPYTPSEMPQTATADAFSQPLPSPASVSQEAAHEAPPLARVLYIIGAVIFLAIYTIFWVKVFNLPFLF